VSRTIRTITLILAAWAASNSFAANPVGWRNDGTGAFPSATPPSEWSSDKNVLWKVSLPGASYGAPIVVGENLFVTSDPSELLCIRRKDGKVLWRKANNDIEAPAPPRGGRGGPGGPGGAGGRGGLGGRSAGNTAATPVSDGKHVATVLGNGVVAVYDLEGKRLWGKFIESPRIGFGHSSSPLLLDGKVIVHIKDLVALDVATGKEAWRVELTAGHASPVAARLGKEDVIIDPAGAVVRAHDGKVLGRGRFRSTDSSPVVQGDTVYLFGQTLEAHKLTVDGDEVKVTSLWSRSGAREMHHLPSPLVHDGLLYGVTTGGYLEVIDAKTGTNVYRERLGVGQVYSSVALAGNMLYVLDLRGKAVVFKPGRKFERVAVNELDGTGSCPVFDGNHLYVRGTRTLYCVSTKEKGDS
jgi:outer membrane protein assembly factor BamB